MPLGLTLRAGGVVIPSIIVTSFPLSEKMELEVLEVSLAIFLLIPAQSELKTTINDFLAQEFSWSGASFEHPDIRWLNQPDETLSIERVRDVPQIVSTKPLGQTRF